MWDFHNKAFEDIPVKLVGHNPTIPDSIAADSWYHLKSILQSYRFFIHTVDPKFEDGFNMAVMEAMAAGMPVLGNCHPTSPAEHGLAVF